MAIISDYAPILTALLLCSYLEWTVFGVDEVHEWAGVPLRGGCELHEWAGVPLRGGCELLLG